jgi:hypothetical protein
MLVVPLRVVVFAALGLLLMQAGEAQAIGGTFNPTGDVTLSDYNACATADITSVFEVPTGDMNFQVDLNLTPDGWGLADPDMPIGAVVGQLTSQSTLGLLGSPCNQVLNVAFTLYNATVDTTDELARAAPPAEPQDSVVNPDPSVNYPSQGAEHYPEWLNDVSLFQGLHPIFRSIGLNTTAAPPTKVVLQFVVFEPGTCLPHAPCPPPPGYVAVTVLQDPTTVGPGAITDFCTIMHSNNVTYGLSKDNPATTEDESGYVVRRNPIEAGTYTFLHYARTYYNADGDPYENYLDTCPLATNTENPRLTCGPDGDCLDSVCDPTQGTKSPVAGINCGGSGLPDYDQDCYPDAADNCPQVANGIFKNGTLIGPDNQVDTDTDYIGDACDTVALGTLGPTTPDTGALDTLPDNLPTDIEIAEVADCDGDGMPNTYELAHTCLDPLVDDADEDADDDGASNIDEMDANSDPCVAGGGAGGTPTATATATATGTVVVGAETTLAEDADAGATEITVADATGFAVGDTIEIGTGDTKETNTITAIDGETFTLATALESDHAAGEPVVKVVPAVASPTPTVVEGETCSPVFPGTYNGRVLIDGKPAASGYQLTATIDDLQWGSAIISGGRYAMDIPDHMPTVQPCFEGGTITFALNGMTCTPAEEGADVWNAGIRDVDLNCAPVAPPVTPTVTPTVAPPPTVTPAGPTVTPAKPPSTGAGGMAGSGPGLPLWAMALAGWVGLMAVAGLGTVVAAKRR